MEQTILNLGQAVSVLVQAAEMAQTKGIFSLKDSALIFQAISFIDELNKANQPQEDTTDIVEDNREVQVPKLQKIPKGPAD